MAKRAASCHLYLLPDAFVDGKSKCYKSLVKTVLSIISSCRKGIIHFSIQLRKLLHDLSRELKRKPFITTDVPNYSLYVCMYKIRTHFTYCLWIKYVFDWIWCLSYTYKKISGNILSSWLLLRSIMSKTCTFDQIWCYYLITITFSITTITITFSN